ncbi:hypothetical protein Ddye_023125 [Dipteronia dyeriana]|uniref:Protein FAR1-RELATED SEQUENCE n=1 Tax=Dipteronia dyeriana TaxID=168575 RepID=A0AAD9TSE0_9ROSI|nr:hypothetical protein Ddye_023125 [Dipteronia dyeriana]
MHKDRLCKDTHELITVRMWVCSKEGYRSKKNIERIDRVHGPRGQIREGCQAAMKINFDKKKMLWVVTEFENHHCHKLLSGKHSQFLRSHRCVDDCDIAQVQSLGSVGVKTSQVMDHLLDQSGSYSAVGHTRKDLQNRLDTILRYIGDVMSFDTTYRTNSYNRPLVIFVGVNNNTKTTVFGFGLLVDEIVNTYT